MRRMTPSQYQAFLRQQQARMNQAIRQHNQEVDRINRANRAAAERAVRDYNREVDRVNRHNREVDRVNRHNARVIDDYNRTVSRNNERTRLAVKRYNDQVRTHNNAVERDRRRQVAALRSSTSARYLEVRRSTVELNDSFEEMRRSSVSAANPELVALSEREADNSADVAEALLADEPIATATSAATDDANVLDYLAGFSQDLCDRWRGALFSLNPENPDAGRHFCTSAREIFTEMLDQSVTNEEVVEADPSCDRAPNHSAPSRRAKLRYLLKRKNADTPQMLSFVEKDVDDVLQLFRVFNEATHGAAGRHGFAKLQAIRRRVEGGIMFLAAVAL